MPNGRERVAVTFAAILGVERGSESESCSTQRTRQVDFAGRGASVVIQCRNPSCSTVPAGPTHHHGRTVSVLVSEGGGFELII